VLEDMISLAKEAGEILKEGYFGKKEIFYKGKVDLVTKYDIKIDAFLKYEISSRYPDFSIIAEESGESGEGEEGAIYIDPIDGTTNFVHSIPFCCVSIGVWKKNSPYIGVVYNPILDELFYAKRGEGAFLNGSKIKVSNVDNSYQALLATGFPYTKVEMGEDFKWVIKTMKNLLPKTRDIRRLGSAALDLCYVARGSFDAFYECNLKPWDVAAGICILKEAGGRVSNEKGKEYKMKDHIIVASNGNLHNFIIENL